MHVVGAGGGFDPAGYAASAPTTAEFESGPERELRRPADRGTDPEPPGAGTRVDPDETVRREGQARDVIYRALATRDHSTVELRGKLAKRGFDEDLAERVLARFVRAGLVDDAAFARRWVESRHRSAGRGRRALAMELQRKGIGGAAAAEALDQVSRDDERERAAELVERKLARQVVPADRTERDRLVQRLVGMLGRRGYHPSLALSVVMDRIRAATEAETAPVATSEDL